MKKRTAVIYLMIALAASVTTLAAAMVLYHQRNELFYGEFNAEQERIQYLKAKASLWPDDWTEGEPVLHADWTDEEKLAIRRMDAYLRHGYYEAAIARNEHLKQQIAAGIIEPCPCGFDNPYSDLALKLDNKARNAPVRLALLQMAASCNVDVELADGTINMALQAAMCREWELARSLVRRGCSPSTPSKRDSGTLIAYVLSADIPSEEMIRFLEFFHQRGEQIWGDNRDICYTAHLRNTPQKITHPGPGQSVVESYLPAQGGGVEVLAWAYDKGLLTEIEWYDVLPIHDSLPLLQRFLQEGKLSLEVTPNEYYSTPVQKAVILAAPPIREGLSMADILQKLEWMLANGADPNALPSRYSERGDRRFLPLAMCRRVLTRTDLQDRDAWLRMEELLLKHGAKDH
ncbi:MAG: hypothetical protein IKZ13_05115 [Akkermansia sp.]|nr:hypothetical protein [Akkermansia sp.]